MEQDKEMNKSDDQLERAAEIISKILNKIAPELSRKLLNEKKCASMIGRCHGSKRRIYNHFPFNKELCVGTTKRERKALKHRALWRKYP